MAWGFKEDEKKQFAKFGLNQCAKLTNFKVGEDQNYGVYVDITFKIGDSEVKTRIFDVKRAYDYETKQWVEDPKHPAFIQEIDNQSKWFSQMINAYADNKEEIQKAFNKEFKSFKDFLKAVAAFLKTKKDKCVDIFLEWEPKIKTGQKRTWLRIPTRYRYTEPWISKHIEGEFDEYIAGDGALYYLDKENRKQHPLWRNAYFMNSNRAKKQTIEDGVEESFGGNEDSSDDDWGFGSEDKGDEVPF